MWVYILYKQLGEQINNIENKYVNNVLLHSKKRIYWPNMLLGL